MSSLTTQTDTTPTLGDVFGRRGVLFAPKASDPVMPPFEVGGGDAVPGPSASKEPVPTGGALFTDVFTNEIHRIGVDGPAGNLVHVVYDSDWNELDRWSENPLPNPYFVYWPQGHIQLGDYRDPAYRQHRPQRRWKQPPSESLVAGDSDWNAVAVEEVNAPGAGRPWIARRDNLLLMTDNTSHRPRGLRAEPRRIWRRCFQPRHRCEPGRLYSATGRRRLRRRRPGPSDDDKDGCGCSTGGSAGLLALLVGAVGAARRRRSLRGD